MLTIRAGQVADLGTLISMWKQLDDHVINETKNNYLRQRDDSYISEIKNTLGELLDGRNTIILVAERDGDIIGFITAHIETLPWFKPSTGLLGSCWVNEKERDCGVGRQLVNHAESWLKKRKVINIQVCWDSGNKVANGFWTKNGYSISQFRGVKNCEY